LGGSNYADHINKGYRKGINPWETNFKGVTAYFRLNRTSEGVYSTADWKKWGCMWGGDSQQETMRQKYSEGKKKVHGWAGKKIGVQKGSGGGDGIWNAKRF